MDKTVTQSKNQNTVPKLKEDKSTYYETVKMNNFKESARLEGITIYTASYNQNLLANSKSALIEKYSNLNSSNSLRGG